MKISADGKEFNCQIYDSSIQSKNVRLDLFLKTSRLVKRRTVAQELCDAGRVLVNGAAAKPAKEVRPGDILTMAFSSRTVEIEVLGLPSKARTAAPEEIYRIRSQERRRDEQDP